MPRTTESRIRDVLLPGNDYDLDAAPSLAPFLRAANLMVTRVAACALTRGWALTTDELTEVETWLAAHFYVMSDQTYSNRSTLDASGGFQGQTGMGLEASKYGQTAVMLDPSGCLNALGKRQAASLDWIGKPPSTQVPYSDRD